MSILVVGLRRSTTTVGHTRGVTNRLRPGGADRLPLPGQRLVVAVAAVVLALGVAGCGRSAPEGAVADSTDGAEPVAAGIRVVSDQTVVPPSSTTLPPVTETTTTTVPTSTAPAGTYIIEPGDTLSVIAERFGVSVDAISEANQISDVNAIQPGQELIIPGAG